MFHSNGYLRGSEGEREGLRSPYSTNCSLLSQYPWLPFAYFFGPPRYLIRHHDLVGGSPKA
jgi:hypothetical protein